MTADLHSGRVRLVRLTQLVLALAVPLLWVAGLVWRGSEGAAGAGTLVLPALMLSQELTVLVVKGRISRSQAALIRLAVIAAVVVGLLALRAVAG